MKNFTIYSGLILLLISLTGCASSKEFNSSMKNQEIQIDGNLIDWEGKLTADEDENISVGFTNDTQNLYLCLATKNRMRMMQILRNGFTVWIHSPNSDKKTIGIKYPIAAVNSEQGMTRQMQGNPFMDEKFEELVSETLSKQTEILIVNKDLFPLTALQLLNKEGLEIKLGFHKEQLVYEMKIALKDFCKGEYCVDANAGEQIELTLQTEKTEIGKPGTRGMRPGRNMGGQRGSGNRRPPEGSGMENFKPLDPLDYNVKLNLINSDGANTKQLD